MKKYEENTAWVAETADYIKDWIYTVTYKHKLRELIDLTVSLTTPFALFDVQNNLPPDHIWIRSVGIIKDRRKYMIENLFEYFGISYEKNKSSRIAALFITKILEDLTQI